MAENASLEKILEISRLMMVTVDLDSLLSIIIAHALELLDSERASILLYDSTTNELISRVATGEEEIRFPADKGIAGATIVASETLNIPDAYADDRFNPQVDKSTGFVTRTILSTPLFDFAGELVGVLQVLNKRNSHFSTDDERIAEALASQAGVALQRSRLLSHYREKMEMERAMEIAREIQSGLLPRGSPDVPGFDIAGFNRPADQTGGDVFDFIELNDGRWLLLVADASGHGIGPALVIAETRAMLRASTVGGCDLSQLLSTANRLLANDLDGRFVTCFIGLLDPASQRMVYMSAGHGPLLFYRHSTDSFEQISATGLPLGILGDEEYTESAEFIFTQGDMALITTDGFFEAMNPAEEQFGVERIVACARGHQEQNAGKILNKIYLEVVEFLADQPAQDDQTAVLIKRLPT